jgi:hypothetical protein
MGVDGTHLDLDKGDRMAAELLVHWAMRASSAAPRGLLPPRDVPWLTHDRNGLFGPTRKRQSKFTAHLGRLKLANDTVAALCVDFDRADSPYLRQQNLWRFVEWDNGTDPVTGRAVLKPKPGVTARSRGAHLRIDTTRDGHTELRLGFLRTYSSGAVAQLRCIVPCICADTNLSTHTARTSTTHFKSVAGGVSSPRGSSCQLELSLLTDEEPFKLISMHAS